MRRSIGKRLGESWPRSAKMQTPFRLVVCLLLRMARGTRAAVGRGHRPGTAPCRGRRRSSQHRRHFPGETVVRRELPSSHDGWLVRTANRELVLIDAVRQSEKTFGLAADAEVLLDGRPAQVEDFRTTLPAWHPHQLRHTKATEIRREAGLDAARVVLGHRSQQITEPMQRST